MFRASEIRIFTIVVLLINSGTKFLSRSLLLLGLVVMLSACASHYRWHQKLTLVIDTPDGEASGSSVTKMYIRYGGWRPLTNNKLNAELTGEAAMVELAPGKYLFALLKGTKGIAEDAYRKTVYGDKRVDTYERLYRYLESPRAAVEVAPKDYPLLVTFKDIDDPASVKQVDPDDLAASFGPGYALKSITLEITDEPVTQGKVKQVLGWLGPHPEPGLCKGTGQTKNIPFCRSVKQGFFIRR